MKPFTTNITIEKILSEVKFLDLVDLGPLFTYQDKVYQDFEIANLIVSKIEANKDLLDDILAELWEKLPEYAVKEWQERMKNIPF